jgi:putative transposase
MLRRHELSDSQWESIRNLVPGKATDPGRTGKDNRRFVNAVLYMARTGIPWRDLPERFGPWNSVWRRFDRWCAKGVWTKIATVLGEPDLEELHLDSTSVKAHQSACGSRRRSGEKKKTLTSDDASAVHVGG